MKNREFDNWLVGKMNELEQAYDNKELVPPEEASWKHMSSLINTHQVNSQFDDQLKSTLSNARVLDSKANWEQFQSKLQLLRERRNKIVGTRIAEVLILLLLFWTVQTVSDPIFNSPLKNSASPIASINTSIESQSIKNENAEEIDKKVSNQNDSQGNGNRTQFKVIDKAKGEINKETLNHTSKLIAISKTGSIQETADSKTGITNSTNSSVIIDASENSSSLRNQANELASPNQTVNPVESLDSPTKKNELIQNNNDTKSEAPTESINDDKNSDLKTSEADQVNSEPLLISGNKPKGLIPHKVNSVNRVFWLGYSMGVSGIQTTNARYTPEFVNLKANYQISTYKNVFMNFDYQSWMIQTGVKFFELNLYPGDYIDYGKFDENESIDQISKINYKMIEVPIILNRKLINTSKWDFAGFAGLSIVICNKAKYEFRKNTGINRKDFYNDPNDNLRKLNYNFNYGLSIDEVWDGNSYTNFLFGFNGAYKLLDYFHLVSNISYSSMLDKTGFGPISNSFKNISADIGVRYSFQ